MRYFRLKRDDGKEWITDKLTDLLEDLGLVKFERSLRNSYKSEDRWVKVKDKGCLYRLERFEAKRKPKLSQIKKKLNLVKTAVLLGDIHFCYEDKDAVDILYQIIRDNKDVINEIIDGGDGINNDALSKFTSTEDERFTLYDEIKAFDNHMSNLKEILPNAKFSIVEDNHYHLRKKRFLADNPAMKGMMKDIDFKFDNVSPHGVPYFPFDQTRVGVIHGLRVNDNFTKGHSALFKEDIINFHTHGSQHYTCKNGSKMLNKQAQKMWGMPSMCKQMDYMNGSPSRSNTGFGVLNCYPENEMYELQYVFVENGMALYNGKLYTSELLDEKKNYTRS